MAIMVYSVKDDLKLNNVNNKAISQEGVLSSNYMDDLNNPKVLPPCIAYTRHYAV